MVGNIVGALPWNRRFESFLLCLLETVRSFGGVWLLRFVSRWKLSVRCVSGGVLHLDKDRYKLPRERNAFRLPREDSRI